MRGRRIHLDIVQQQVLLVLFATEQALEEEYRAVWQDRRTPVSSTGWRWMRYHSYEGQDTPLKRAVRRAGLLVNVSDVVWETLAALKLVEYQYLSISGEATLEVQMTTKGRQHVRRLTGKQGPRRPPLKILSERQWEALLRLWQAGEEGIGEDIFVYGPGGFSWSVTLKRLFYYRPEPLISTQRHSVGGVAYRITEAGQQFCRDQWSRYHDLYPRVRIPEQITAETH